MAQPTPPSLNRRSGGFVYRLRQFHLMLAVLFVTTVVLQVFFAGLGVLVSPEYFGLHVSLGHLVSLPIFGLFITGLLGRSGWRSVGGSAALFFLYGLQYAFLEGTAGPVRALHAVNALLMFWLALQLATRAWAGVRAAAPLRSAPRGRSFGQPLAGGVLVLAGAVVLFGAMVGNGPGWVGPGWVGTAFMSEEPSQQVQAVSSGSAFDGLGRKFFAQRCSSCHGASGEGRPGARR